VLGFFAPKVETALSGAGWETTGSQSVQARQLIDRGFRGLSSYALMTVIYSPARTINDPAFKSTVARVEATLGADTAVRSVVPPTAGVSISRDGHTAIVQAGAAESSNGMVKSADSLKAKLAALSGNGMQVHLTGASGMWSDFNAANRSAMLKSEVPAFWATFTPGNRTSGLAYRSSRAHEQFSDDGATQVGGARQVLRHAKRSRA
jgi:putative drug exporter of the RND superfamily